MLRQFQWHLRKEIKKKSVKILADCVALTIKDTDLLMLPRIPLYQMYSVTRKIKMPCEYEIKWKRHTSANYTKTQLITF